MLNKLKNKSGEAVLITILLVFVATGGYTIYHGITNPDHVYPLTTEQVLERHKL